MAKFETDLTANFDEVLMVIENAVMKGSSSATFEDGSDFNDGCFRTAVRVYERYSCFGGNRVSLNVTLVGKNDELFLSAITSGGSQAVFFKINTVGEESFLSLVQDAIVKFMNNGQ